MNRAESERYLIKDLIKKANRVAIEATELRDFLINFKKWKYQSSEETQEDSG